MNFRASLCSFSRLNVLELNATYLLNTLYLAHCIYPYIISFKINGLIFVLFLYSNLEGFILWKKLLDFVIVYLGNVAVLFNWGS